MDIKSLKQTKFGVNTSSISEIEVIAQKYIAQGNDCLKRNDFDNAIIKFNIAKNMLEIHLKHFWD